MLEEGGVELTLAYVRGYGPAERRRLYETIQQHAVTDGWWGCSLDAVVALARAGIEELLGQAASGSEEARRALKVAASRMSCQLAADLANCWPDKRLPCEPRHFEAGIRAALDAVRWCDELGQEPLFRYRAWLLCGIHQLALGWPEAADSLAVALSAAQALAREADRSPDLSAAATFEVVQASGFLGLGELAIGEAAGRERYQTATAIFERLARMGGAGAAEAAFGLACLRKAADHLRHHLASPA